MPLCGLQIKPFHSTIYLFLMLHLWFFIYCTNGEFEAQLCSLYRHIFTSQPFFLSLKLSGQNWLNRSWACESLQPLQELSLSHRAEPQGCSRANSRSVPGSEWEKLGLDLKQWCTEALLEKKLKNMWTQELWCYSHFLAAGCKFVCCSGHLGVTSVI